jgi:hypothetical protein
VLVLNKGRQIFFGKYASLGDWVATHKVEGVDGIDNDDIKAVEHLLGDKVDLAAEEAEEEEEEGRNRNEIDHTPSPQKKKRSKFGKNLLYLLNNFDSSTSHLPVYLSPIPSFLSLSLSL